MAPQRNYFSLIIMFEKKTVPLAKVVPFPQNGAIFATTYGHKWFPHIKSGVIFKAVPPF